MKRCKNPDCKIIIKSHSGRGVPKEYCDDCYEQRKMKQDRERLRQFRKNHSTKPSYFRQEINWDIEERCSNCGQKTETNVDYDDFHGEAVCKTCGMIVGSKQE